MKFTAAVIGCGRIGSMYDEGRIREDPRSHAGAYRRSDRTELVAGVDPDQSRRVAFERLWEVPTYPSVREMLTQLRPDIWSLCTPADMRLALADEAMAAGARAIWAEKPLCETLEDARRLARLAEARRVPVAVGYLRRWDAAHIRVHEAIQNGIIGAVQHAVVRYGRGALNYGTHAVDLLRWFVGEPAWVWATPGQDVAARDPSPVIILGLAGGVVAALMPISAPTHDMFEVDLVGTHGRLTLRDRGATIALEQVGEDLEWGEPSVLRPAPSAFPAGLHGMMRAVVDDLVQSIERGTSPRCSVGDGLAVLEVIEASRRSMLSGLTVAMDAAAH